jgi:hypothetical protein
LDDETESGKMGVDYAFLPFDLNDHFFPIKCDQLSDSGESTT